MKHFRKKRVLFSAGCIIGLVVLTFGFMWYPLSNLDEHLLRIIVAQILLYAILLYLIGSVFFGAKHWKTNILILGAFPLCTLNLFVYQQRETRAFSEHRSALTEGKIIGAFSQGGGKSPKWYFISFEYSVNGVVYKNSKKVEKTKVLNAQVNDRVNVLYNLKDPSLSKIR